MAETTFALFFGNRGFFPESLIAGAREEMVGAVKKAGYGALTLDAGATRYGAVESPAEGKVYADFLAANRAKIDGVILCLPNFGDETGAVAALQDAGVPILVQAYPDELDKMDMSVRRDAFCGKFSVMDVFYQYGVKFTTFQPHTVHPSSEMFAQHLRCFAATCDVVKRMRRLTIGAIGARTTAFKTIRFDELALQREGITTETFDLSDVFQRFEATKDSDDAARTKVEFLREYTKWKGVPEDALLKMGRLGAVLDGMIEEFQLDSIALRCWLELEKQLGISPCVLLSELNNRGIAAACELDVCNAVAMTALTTASHHPATCLDWNNNYGEDPEKCILFHCGPVPQDLMTEKGQIVDHPMFVKVLGPGCGYGCNTGRISPAPMTFASTKTHEGKLHYYLGEGRITEDQIPPEFFGCAGVAQIDGLQDVLETVGHEGYRHHVSVTFDHVAKPVREAFDKYLGYTSTRI